MSSKCFANLDKCSRGTDEGWHICVPCYRGLEDKDDYELLDVFKPEKICHYPGCWNRQLETSLYCKGVKHQQIRADKKWSEEHIGSMIQTRERLERKRGNVSGMQAYIGGVIDAAMMQDRESFGRTRGSAFGVEALIGGVTDRGDQSNMAAKEKPLENMEIAMQCLDRMNEVQLAAIAKHAITQLQQKLPLGPEPIQLHARKKSRS